MITKYMQRLRVFKLSNYVTNILVTYYRKYIGFMNEKKITFSF